MADTNNNVCSKDGRMLFGGCSLQHVIRENSGVHMCSDLINFLETTKKYLNEDNGE
jgi:hypothetical protein